MVKRHIFGTAFLIVLLTGCGASTPEKQTPQPVKSVVALERPQPDWTTGPSKDYPRLDYITARSEGITETEASEKAVAKIARMFMVDIKTYNMSQQQALQTAGYVITHTLMSENELMVAAPEIDRVLKRIKVVDTWYDRDAKTYHALAALARNTGKGYLRKQIQMLDTYTTDYLSFAKNTKDHLTKMGMTAMAWRAQQLRTTLQESMQQVDLTRRGLKASYDLNKIEKEINNYINNIKIYPTGLKGEPNAKLITNMLRDALKAADLKPSSKEASEYTMQAVLDVSIAGENNGWAVGQGDIKVVLLNSKDDKLLGTKQWQVRVQGLDEDSAKRRVVEKTEFAFKTEIRNILIDMSLGF